MPINVVCPGCKKRFSVSEKFAGQKGPCPSCKTVISIPEKSEEVVIHAPEVAGPTDSKGRSVVTPIFRQEVRVTRTAVIGVVVAVLLVLGIAFGLRVYDGKVPLFIKVLGAISVAPPLVWAAYEVLRDSELEPYRGQEFWVRGLSCAAVYAVLWAIYALVPGIVNIEVTVYSLGFFAVPIVLAGGFAAHASLDLDYSVGLLHYSFYLLVTVLLRVCAGLSAF